jgi:hypothetical protein
MRAFAVIALLAASLARSARADGETPLEVRVGQSIPLCAYVQCPVSAFLCDDPRVAIVRNGKDGAELAGVAKGTTLCSALGLGGASRRVFRVTVTAAERTPAR